MKLVIGILICLGIFIAVVAMFARVLSLMACVGGDMTEEMEQDFASNTPPQSAPDANQPAAESDPQELTA